jgi:hypothetical protein
VIQAGIAGVQNAAQVALRALSYITDAVVMEAARCPEERDGPDRIKRTAEAVIHQRLSELGQ